MAIKVSGITVIDNNRLGAFVGLNVGTYTTANRPSSPNEGDIIFDSETKELLVWNGTEWSN